MYLEGNRRWVLLRTKRNVLAGIGTFFGKNSRGFAVHSQRSKFTKIEERTLISGLV